MCQNNCCGCPQIRDDFYVYGNQFTSPTEYANQFLIGRYRLTYTGFKKLVFGIDWEQISGGGFRILLPGFSNTDARIEGEFY